MLLIRHEVVYIQRETLPPPGGTAGNPNAYAIGAVIGDLSSLNPTVNIDSLMIKASDLASRTFRI